MVDGRLLFYGRRVALLSACHGDARRRPHDDRGSSLARPVSPPFKNLLFYLLPLRSFCALFQSERLLARGNFADLYAREPFLAH